MSPAAMRILTLLPPAIGGVTMLIIGSAMVVAACGEPPPVLVPGPPACDPVRLAELEGLYLAEVLVLCKGYELETCPAVPALERRHAERVEEWIKCR